MLVLSLEFYVFNIKNHYQFSKQLIMKKKFNRTTIICGFKFVVIINILFCVLGNTYAQDELILDNDTCSIDTFLSESSLLSLSPPGYFGKEQNVIPPSPTAASLGKYGEIPVSMFSGTPNIEIPLFNLESTKLSLPISMSYQATGVKVEEIPGWVGLGWSLNAGGVITRSVRGLADDKNNGYLSYCNNIPANFFGVSCQFLMDIAESRYDTEPDVFFFNFAGLTGKFVLGNDGMPKLIPFQKLEITK